MTGYEVRHVLRGAAVYVRAPGMYGPATFEECVVAADDWRPGTGRYTREELLMAKIIFDGGPLLVLPDQLELV